MSNPTDLAKLQHVLSKLGGIPKNPRVLYVGCHDVGPARIIASTFPGATITKLDFQASWRPDVVHDLDSPEPIPGNYHLAVCPSVLMHLLHPHEALDKLIASSEVLVLQEHIVRQRPDKDPWPDRCRCFSSASFLEGDFTPAMAAMGAPGARRKVLVCVDRPGLRSVHYYGDKPDCLTGIWTYRRWANQ